MDPSSDRPTRASSLQDELSRILPTSFKCKTRYIRTPQKPCDPLFSPPPGHEPERTRLASHFLTVSIVPAASTSGDSFGTSYLQEQTEGVFILAIEVLVYTTKHLTTIFVNKADTTGYLPRRAPSKTRLIVATFLRRVVLQQRQKHPSRTLVISLFARAQSQYLFPGSADNGRKRPLDDRQLIRWWATVLDPIIDLDGEGQPQSQSDSTTLQGYITVPGYDATELRSYLPPNNSRNGTVPRWKAGDPLEGLAGTRGVSLAAPPRCLLPRFPDDPKARFMQDLDDEVGLTEYSKVTVSPSKRKNGRWTGVTDLKRFWEAMEFRQECSSGRVVGFIWLVVAPLPTSLEMDPQIADSQESQMGALSSDTALERDVTPMPMDSPKKRKRKPLAGPIVTRQPRLKGGTSSLTATSSNLTGMLNTPAGDGLLLTKEGYDKAMQTLLHLDFANLDIAARSTSKWVAEVCSICGLSSDWAIEIIGTARQDDADHKVASGGDAQVNDLGGMIRKKRRAADDAASEGRAVVEKRVETAGTEIPAVNVLGGGMIRKKAKPVST